MAIKALQNRLDKLERLANPDPGLMVHVVVDGEDTAPALNSVKGVLMVTLASDLGGIPVVYEEPIDVYK